MASRFSLQFPGRRDANDPWFRIGNLDVTTTTFVCLLVAVSMFVWALSPKLLEPLVLWPPDVRSGQIWRVATWPLANEPTIWGVVGIAVFWLVGNELERVTGRVKFAWLLVAITVGPGIVGALLDLPAAGFRYVQFAVLLVYIAEYPMTRFFFNIPAWVFGAVFVGIEILQRVGLRDGRGLVFLFVSLAIAAVAARSIGLFHQYAWIPSLGRGGSGGSTPKKSKKVKTSRGSNQVVQGPWAPPGGPSPADQAELDALLDKIGASGMESLSKGEKQRLNELSKRLRGG